MTPLREFYPCYVDIIDSENVIIDGQFDTDDLKRILQILKKRKWRFALPRIGDVKMVCKCGWRGDFDVCEPDVDGDGSLGCPMCFAVVEQEAGNDENI